MSDDTKMVTSLLALVAFIALMAFVAGAAAATGYHRKSAVKQGYAEYFVTDNATVGFRWLEEKKYFNPEEKQ